MPGKPIRVRPITIMYTVVHGIVDMHTKERPRIGDVFYHPRMLIDARRDRAHERLSLEFWRAFEKRQRYPIVLVLPDGVWWVIDQRAYSRALGFHGNGWTVTRIPPLSQITVRPSIRTERYHGILTRGMLVPCVDSQM